MSQSGARHQRDQSRARETEAETTEDAINAALADSDDQPRPAQPESTFGPKPTSETDDGTYEADDAQTSANEPADEDETLAGANEEGGKHPEAEEAESADEPPQDEEAQADGDQPIEELDGMEDASDRAKDRIRELAESRKTLRQELEAANKQRDESMHTIEAINTRIEQTGAPPEDVSETLDYLALRTAGLKGDAKSARQALSRLDAERQMLAMAAGQSEDFDPLSAFPQLQQRVNDMELDREEALQYARGEVANAYMGRRQQQQNQDQQRAQQQQTSQHQVEQAAAATAQAHDRLLATYPTEHADRMALLGEDFAERIAQQYPPEQWAQQFEREYDQAGRMLARVAKDRPRRIAPLSGGSAGGARPRTRQPQNTAEAIEAALGDM
ncbi:MAG: hypothetical protein L0H73_13280 [Nitrococcus sp.]|nr:hypothetical protein [Nitrococcus sp.]